MDNERASSIGGEKAQSNNTKQSSSLTFLSPLSLFSPFLSISVVKIEKKNIARRKPGKPLE